MSNSLMENKGPLFTEAELAKELNTSIWKIRQWRKFEGLPHLGKKRHFLYRLETVNAWIAQQEAASTHK